MDIDEKGLNSNTATGTEAAVDPETGTVGTAGTPLTTGYGMSGSTIGTGSRAGEAENEAGDYAGPTPESKDYTRGVHGESSAEVSSDGMNSDRKDQD